MFPHGGLGRRAQTGPYPGPSHHPNPHHQAQTGPYPGPSHPNPQHAAQTGPYPGPSHPNPQHQAQTGLYPGPSHPNPQHQAQNHLYLIPPNRIKKEPLDQPLGNNCSGRAQAPPIQQFFPFVPPSAIPRPQKRWPSPNDTTYTAKRRKRLNEDHSPQQQQHHHHAPPPIKQERAVTPPPLPTDHAPHQQHHHHAPPPSKQRRLDPPAASPPPPPPARHGAPAVTAGRSVKEEDPPPRTPPLPRSDSKLYPYATDKLSSQMVEVYESCQQQLSDLQQKEVFRTWLQADINRLFPEGRLYLTGSSMSGLACRSSDADLCLVLDTWSPLHPPRGFLGFLQKALKQMRDLHRPDPINVLSSLLRLFRTLPYLRETHLIRAKVPILRFIETVSGVEFDLNVNNTVGIRNTFLLRSYGEADPRVKALILVIKKWARRHQINDASKGTLSSYTLVLMVISYLQILHKPVLPSLQRDFPECFHPDMEVDMVPHGPRDIPAYHSKNQSPLGDLLLGFLQHYATVFRWDKEVVSVREARRLTKQNSGAREFISVEEPFERNNVARAVHEKMKFDAIKAQFNESYHKLSQNKDLDSILPVGETINDELSGR